MTEKILKDVKISDLNTPNKNGQIYSSRDIEKLIAEKDHYYGTIGMPPYGLPDEETYFLDIATISHEVFDLQIVDNLLIGDVRIYNTYNGGLLKQLMLATNMEFRLACVGILNPFKMLIDPKIISINAVTDGA
jgi:hypothetical protein